MVVLSEVCEGFSSSSSTHGQRYDVFLSFRGIDTRNSFTSHLHKALMDVNIATFLDDEEIETGEDLKPELESAVKASRASVIVLSKNYATSTWCLDELVLILERRRNSNHIVIPIFYHVEPTHVRKQESSFRDAMDKHRQTMEAETDAKKRSKLAQKIEGWNKALTEVANLKGMDVNGRQETQFIEEIVMAIYRRLHISSRFPPPQLIGMEDHVEDITSWLKDASTDTTDILTIVGMGGIGKTSLAKYVYALHSHQFDTSSFIEDISRRCDEKYHGLLDVQKQLFDNISKPSSVKVRDVSIYTSMIENAVACKKVFLVLDDIGNLDQLDVLLGSKGFHPGSKIIITTKDAWLTMSCVLSKTNGKTNHATLELEGLSETESQKLLCCHAFMCSDPKEGYEKVSKDLVKYCEGHPMALKVLGRSLHNQDVSYWEEHIELLKKENGSPVNNVLKMSFNSLGSKNDKELFKHIACFFVGMDTDLTLTILDACDIKTRSGITNLIDRCLLSIEWNKFTMHQLVQEMGRFVVREESPSKPWERSRLWGHDSFKVLEQKRGTENVLGLTLDMRMLEKEKLPGSVELKTDALCKMDSLMLLQLNYVQITDSYKIVSKELRWLCMHGFPLKSIPSELSMENLVSLDMSYSRIESFGIYYSYLNRLHKRLKQLTGSCSKDERLFGSLKILNLSFCEQLHSLGDFDHLPKLESLILTGCIGLLEVCESVEQCLELAFVDLSYCINLKKLPRIIGMLKNVKTMLLDGCSLGEAPTEKLILKSIPNDMKFFMIPLPRSLVELSLANNNLSTESFPMDFSCLSMLEALYLDNNPIISMPDCVRRLPRLEFLYMNKCKLLTSIERPPRTVTWLEVQSGIENPLLQKLVFDPEMSRVSLGSMNFPHSSCEIEGVIKIQPMEGVEGKILQSLGWTKQDFLNKRHIQTFGVDGVLEEFGIQMYFEFGIFSTFYGGAEIPDWITDRSIGPSISFTIPSSPKKLTGLNFCYVQKPNKDMRPHYLPLIQVHNLTKNLTWIYHHYIGNVNVDDECFIFLSHWMFGMNEVECGDNINVTVCQIPHNTQQITLECGVSFMYDNGDNDEEENDLSYYKSWNHILGGDLSGFQITTGQYILYTYNFVRSSIEEYSSDYRELVGDGVNYKDVGVQFRPLSQKKSGMLGYECEVYF